MRLLTMNVGIVLAAAASGCAPNKFASSLDVSGDVKVRPAGFMGTPGRVNLDCFVDKVNGNEFNQGNRPQALGIPMNCPNNLQVAGSDAALKYDIAVVVDVSENMLPVAASLKTQLVQVLSKLNSDGRIGTLSAVSFRNKIVANVANGEPAKLISDIGGEAAEWKPNGLKTVDSNSTDWVTNEAAKAVFAGIEEGIKHLQSGSNTNKMLMLVSASTGSGSSGTDVGPTAKIISDFSSKLASNGGQLIVNYAANNQIATGLSKFDPTAIEQMDLLTSTAGIKPVRILVPADLVGWTPAISSRASISSANTEACTLTSFEATDASGQLVFKKDVSSTDTTGVFEASLPPSVPNGTLKLTVTRKCSRTGSKSKLVTITLAQGGAAK
ncbi:hypothetical protein EBR21_08370 [bacterium]|nr:hypothetical protein [bacterium]